MTAVQPVPARVEAVVNIAAILLSEYQQGTPFHDLAQRDGEVQEDTTFVVEVDAAGGSLRGLVATLDGVALAVDAAAVAVFYDREIPWHTAQEPLNYDLLRQLADEPPVSFQITELSGGSFGGKFTARFLSPVTRATVIGLANVGSAALAFLFPPLGVPVLVLTGAASVIEVAGTIRDRRAEQSQQQRQAEVNASLRQRIDDQDKKIDAQEKKQAALGQDNEELRAQLRRLEEKYAELQPPPVDLGAVREARIKSIEAQVEGPPQAA